MPSHATTAPPKSTQQPSGAGQQSPAGTPRRPSIDVKAMRERARHNIESGAVTEDYRGDRGAILELLDQALATELLCVLRYKRHYYMAYGLSGGTAAAEFLEHAKQEEGHADSIAQRIVQLRGEPNFNPDTLSRRSHAEYAEGKSLRDMVKEDLIGAHRHRKLSRHRRVHRRPRSDHAAAHGEHPGRGGRARRRPRHPARGHARLVCAT